MSIDHHVRGRQIDLARSIASRKKVYLDLRFWIIARDAAMGTDQSASARKLLHLLRRGVAQGMLVCPVSESTVLEVMKQANTVTRRRATASLIDELSLGVALVQSRRRVSTEIAYFFHRFGTALELEPQEDLVWTKLAYALGELFPSVSGIDPVDLLTLQVGLFERMWAQSLTEMLEVIGDAEHPDRSLREAAQRVAAGISAHATDLVSYEQTYRDEVIGAIDGCGACTGEIMATLAERAGVAPPEPNSPQWETAVGLCKGLLVGSMEKPEARAVLRTLHAIASLHAGLRWDRSTKFAANHFYDFDHAAGAVAYCDAFFTEGFLAHLANARHVRLHELNGCQITSSVDQAVDILRRISQP